MWQSIYEQSGATLIEAMIATLLLMITMVGVAIALTRTLDVQRHTNAQNIAVLEVRHKLSTDGMCGVGTSISVGSAGTVELSESPCGTGTGTTIITVGTGTGISVHGQGINAFIETISGDDSKSLFGGNGVIRFSYE